MMFHWQRLHQPLYEQPIEVQQLHQGLLAQLNESVHRPTFLFFSQSVLCTVNLFVCCFSDIELKLFCN